MRRLSVHQGDLKNRILKLPQVFGDLPNGPLKEGHLKSRVKPTGLKILCIDKNGEFQSNKFKKKERVRFFTISYFNIVTKKGEIDVLTR